METESQAHSVIVAPSHSKLSYYLLMRSVAESPGRIVLILMKPMPEIENCLSAIKPNGNLSKDFTLQSSFSS